jgi:hypothetical protein
MTSEMKAKIQENIRDTWRTNLSQIEMLRSSW